MNEERRHPQDPAEGSREAIESELERSRRGDADGHRERDPKQPHGDRSKRKPGHDETGSEGR